MIPLQRDWIGVLTGPLEIEGLRVTLLALVAMLLLAIRLTRAGQLRRGNAAGPTETGVEAPLASNGTMTVALAEAGGFERRPLLSLEARQLLPVLERAVRSEGRGLRVMAQAALDDLIRPTGSGREEVAAALGAVRLDFAVLDPRGFLLCAVDYGVEGRGRPSATLDALRRAALRHAGVPLLEVRPGYREETVERALREALGLGAEDDEDEGAVPA